MTHPLPKSPLRSSTNQVRNNANPDPGRGAPDNPTLLNRFAICCRTIAASEVMKNIAALGMIGTGAGALWGCPWVTGFLIGLGVGTSWMGGLGIALIGAGLILWTVSTVLSAKEPGACTNPVLEAGFSALMGVVGIAYVIVTHVLNFFQSCCCGADPDGLNFVPKPVSGHRPEPEQDRNPPATTAQGFATLTRQDPQPPSKFDLVMAKERERQSKAYIFTDHWRNSVQSDVDSGSSSSALMISNSSCSQSARTEAEIVAENRLRLDPVITKALYDASIIKSLHSNPRPRLSCVRSSGVLPENPPVRVAALNSPPFLSQRLATTPVVDTTQRMQQPATLESANSAVSDKIGSS